MSEPTAALSTLAQDIDHGLGASDGVSLNQPCIDELAHCTGADQWGHVANTLVMAMAA